MDNRESNGGPLRGVRVLEVGHFVAAPFCTRLLADLGAEVIKVEPLDGDPVRQWGEQIDGHSLWWSVHGRNKRSVAINLKDAQGIETALSLSAHCDVVVENFRPGQLARLGLSADRLRERRADMIIASVSGYGQDGPYRDRAAFGVIGEAIGGLRYLTNHPPGDSDRPPVRVGVSIGDSIAGLYAAFGVVAALYRRGISGHGDDIDVALTEAVLSMTEGMLPEYGALGKIKQPTGGGIATAAPSNAYPTADSRWILIAANSDALFAKLARIIGGAELAEATFEGNRNRVANAARLDGIIAKWTRTLDATTLETMLNDADIPNSRAYTAADCAADPQYRERGMIRAVDDANFGEVLHTGIVPRFGKNPGAIRWPGPTIGQHGDTLLADLLGYSADRIATLRTSGVIG